MHARPGSVSSPAAASAVIFNQHRCPLCFFHPAVFKLPLSVSRPPAASLAVAFSPQLRWLTIITLPLSFATVQHMAATASSSRQSLAEVFGYCPVLLLNRRLYQPLFPAVVAHHCSSLPSSFLIVAAALGSIFFFSTDVSASTPLPSFFKPSALSSVFAQSRLQPCPKSSHIAQLLVLLLNVAHAQQPSLMSLSRPALHVQQFVHCPRSQLPPASF